MFPDASVAASGNVVVVCVVGEEGRERERARRWVRRVVWVVREASMSCREIEQRGSVVSRGSFKREGGREGGL